MRSRLLRTLLLLGIGSALQAPAQAAIDLGAADLSRPRILFFPDGVAAVQSRLAREPYRTLLRHMDQRNRLADDVALDDVGIEAMRIKARAAKNHAFLYAIDRRIEGDRAVPFASPDERRAAGDRVVLWLRNLHDCSRLNPTCPVNGWDRDISTSEELIQWATAYDTLLGAGYAFDPEDRAEITARLVDLASDLYDNFVNPESAANRAVIHQNNHRSKSGAALAIAAIVLAEYTPPPGSDPRGVRDPARWLAYGLDQMDLIQRWVLMTGDGVYAEGPFYQKFTQENLIPFARAWHRLVGGRSVEARGATVPSLWKHPLWARNQRWLLDSTLPDGSLAHIDDGNVGRSHFFGLFDPESPLAGAFAWAWARGPTPYVSAGNIDLAADAMIYFDDTRAEPAPRPGSPTSFWPEGGNAIFRSAWERDGIVALVLGEGEIASELGRDRDGVGVQPQSHEHADVGSFILHAYGEQLAIDPGYFTFSSKALVDKAEDHNIIRVDGVPPQSLFGASFTWPVFGLENRPLADGLGSIADNLDTDFIDATRVVTRYGRPWAVTPKHEVPRIERRFLFADDRYLVIADSPTDPLGAVGGYDWLLHGNGGETSGGSFLAQPAGGRWTIRGARLDAGLAFANVAPVFSTHSAIHEGPFKAMLTHTVLETRVAGSAPRGVAILYPSPTDQEPPVLADLGLPGMAALRLDDPGEDRRVVAFHRSGLPRLERLTRAASGIADAETDGARGVFDTRGDGSLRLAWVEDATRLDYAGHTLLRSITPGNLGLRLGDRRAEGVAENADPWLRLPALGFRPRRVDGACRLAWHDGGFWVQLGRERRFRVHASPGNGQPAADPGADRRAERDTWVELDGSASCDPEQGRLRPRWTLTSAPPGSDWRLEDPTSWRPRLFADRDGPFRIQLVVTDHHGVASREREVVIWAGDPCLSRSDEDLDGLFDSDDPDCDQPERPGPPTARPDRFRMRRGFALRSEGSVLANDSGARPGEALVAVLDRAPAHGRLWLRPDGRFRYAPYRGGAGPRSRDRFRYRARDASGLESAPVEVVIERRARPPRGPKWWKHLAGSWTRPAS